MKNQEPIVEIPVLIMAHLKLLFPVYGQPGEVNEYWFTYSKEVSLLAIPKKGQCVRDGEACMKIYTVDFSVSGPRFICDADPGFVHGWSDIGDVPRYPYISAYFTSIQLEKAGWEISAQEQLHARRSKES